MKLIVQRGKLYEYVDIDTGTPFFSVTQVRNVMWDGYSKVPYAVLEAGRIRGEHLHTYFALKLGSIRGVCDAPEPLPEYAGYCRAIDRYITEWKPVPRAVEEASCNAKLGIAGTRDADVVQAGTPPGYFDIVDLKGGEPIPTDPVQLLAYQQMVGCEQAARLFDLYVREDGTYDCKEVKPIKHQADWACFLNSLQVLKWRASR